MKNRQKPKIRPIDYHLESALKPDFVNTEEVIRTMELKVPPPRWPDILPELSPAIE